MTRQYFAIFLFLLFTLFPVAQGRAGWDVEEDAAAILTRMRNELPANYGTDPLFHMKSRIISIRDLFAGRPVKLNKNISAFVIAGWFLDVYTHCSDAVLASDPETPFVDPNTGLGPCDFVKTLSPLDVATSVEDATQAMNDLAITFTFDGLALTPMPVATTFEYILRPNKYTTSTCEEDGYTNFLFPFLAESNYLDPSGKTSEDTCFGKDVVAIIPQDYLTEGTHEVVISYAHPLYSEVIPIEVIVVK